MINSESPGPKARIIIHDAGAGAPSSDMVVQRARELAVIAGRRAKDYTEEDFRQARLELVQGPEEQNEESMTAKIPFEPGSGEVLGGAKSEARNFSTEDESTVGEELVREGMDEALHDEMLQARELDEDEL